MLHNWRVIIYPDGFRYENTEKVIYLEVKKLKKKEYCPENRVFVNPIQGNRNEIMSNFSVNIVNTETKEQALAKAIRYIFKEGMWHGYADNKVRYPF